MADITDYRFSGCQVRLATRELWRDDRPVAIEPKAFDLLVFLIRHRDRAVDKHELQDEIWRGTIVTEGALTRCVMKARRAIGDEGDTPGIIGTVRGHGYRFLAEVEESGRVTPARPAVLPLPDKPSVAVMPFSNLSNDPDQAYFADGMTEDIITELSRFRSLFVIARHSSFAFRDKGLRASDIASRLGVAYIVEGSVQRSGARLRINVRLIDAGAEAQVWSERYDRDIGDVLVLQEELARTVAATIGGRVEATAGRRHMDDSHVASYDYLLRALALYYEVSKAANDEARVLLERAVDLDPGNARALILLAAVHSMASWSFWAEDNELARRTALELGRQSLALDDTDSLAHALYAEILFDEGDKDLAERHFRKAVELNPNDIAAHALYASKLSAQGRIDESLAELAVAERLDPFGLLWIPWIKGSVMFNARRYEEAVEALQSMPKPPNEANYLLAGALGRLGRTQQAQKHVRRFLERAAVEMPRFPGETLENWRPVFSRMNDYSSPDDLQHLMDSLQKAGWK